MFYWQFCLGQYSSIDTTYYPNQQIHQIVMKLEGDSIIKIKSFYSQYEKFENGVFQLGEKKEDRIESIKTYIPWGDNGIVQEGYSEYWHETGKKRLEMICSREKGNRYINQWDINSKQILKTGNGIYSSLDIGINGLDSLVYEIRDSLLHGKSIRYEKNDEGSYFIKSVEFFKRNKRIGRKETYNVEGEVFFQEEYLSNSDSILFKMFYSNGKLRNSGKKYRDRKFGEWKYYYENGLIEKEIEFQNGHYNGMYKEFYPNGILRVEGKYKVILQEREVNLLDVETYENVKSIKVLEKSVKTGRWIYQDETGKIKKIELFEDGKLKKENE